MAKLAAKIAAASLVASVAATGIAIACDCIYSGPFVIAARDAPIIIQGKVVSHIEHGLDLEVHAVHRGRVGQTVVRIWGDNGRMCRSDASRFPDGTDWIFALHPVGDLTLDGESQADLQVLSCGEYAVEIVDGNVVTFDEYGKERRVELSEISSRLDGWGPLD